MRTKLIFSSAIAIIFYLSSFSQTCPNETNIANTNVCGLYGDANGNSFWNWELNDPLNSQYCSNWYARIVSTGFLTAMGSPFVNATTGKLKIIADNQDYTKAKGWELLQRKFGCLSNTANPYFVLYNRYSGLARVFVYLSNANYSQILMTIRSVYDHRPATLSFGSDTASLAPDKYLANLAGPASEEKLMSLNESVGSNSWSVAEFNIMLDQNITNTVYSNGSLEVVVYGVTSSTLTAKITGASGNAPAEELKNATFRTKGGTTSGNSFNFSANGEKLLKLSKDLEDFRKGINDNAKKVANALINSNDSLLRKIGRIAKLVENNTNTTADLGKVFESITGFLGTAGTVLKFAGSVIGLIKGSSSTPASSPGFTNYNLNVEGSLSATVVVSNFVLKIPATSTPPNNANNATYYNGPMGIFNLKETPRLDTLIYDRRALLPNNLNPKLPPKTVKYTAYRLHDDVKVVVNAGVGLSVKSVDGALIARVITPPSPPYGSVITLNPFEWHPYRGYYRYFNHMRTDIEANRLEVTHFDADGGGYHIVQTPFYKLECLKSASININTPTLKVFLRLRATLKRTDGLGELIYFVKDYDIERLGGNLADIPADIATNILAIPPYANYTIPPNTSAVYNAGNGTVTVPPSDIIYPDIQTLGNVTLAAPYELKINHTIRTSDTYYTTVTCPNPIVTFRAGSSVTLLPKFEAVYGSVFLATVDFGYLPQVCNPAPDITQYSYAGNYYNSSIIAQKPAVTETAIEKNIIHPKNIYPNPADNSVFLPFENTKVVDKVRVFDMLGRYYDLTFKRISDSYISIDVSKLKNGSYLANIITKAGSKSFRFQVLK